SRQKHRGELDRSEPRPLQHAAAVGVDVALPRTRARRTAHAEAHAQDFLRQRLARGLHRRSVQRAGCRVGARFPRAHSRARPRPATQSSGISRRTRTLRPRPRQVRRWRARLRAPRAVIKSAARDTPRYRPYRDRKEFDEMATEVLEHVNDETTSEQLFTRRPATIEEFWALPESLLHIEYINGEIVMAPSPTVPHQIVQGNLYY